MPRRDGYVPNPTRHGTCPKCGAATITRGGQTTHTVQSRGDAWQGTLAELLDCAPATVSQSETGD